MLTRVEALRFRSLRYLTTPLSRFQVLVGANGSGKSSFLDVVGFLGDLIRVGPGRSVTGDVVAGVAPRAADPSHLCWMREGRRFELAVELRIPDDLVSRQKEGPYRFARYEVSFDTGGDDGEVGLAGETLWLMKDERAEATDPVLFPLPEDPPESIIRGPRKQSPAGWRKVVNKTLESGNDYFFSETSGWNAPFRLGPAKSALANLPEDEERFPVATWVRRVLSDGLQRVVLSAEAMRRPSPAGSPRRYQPDGSNLPWAVEVLRTSGNGRFRRWVDHVRSALPELKDVTTELREEDRSRYLVLEYENGLRAPAWVVSDGTLRLLALTLIPYLAEPDRLYLIEEPENGIHPRAIEVVYQALSSVYGGQVLCASHSPVVLGMAKREEVLCFAKGEAGATAVVRGSEHPQLRDWKGSLDLGTLFAAGVLG